MAPASSSHPKVAALVCAAGAGVRAGEGGPKQFRDLGGAPMLAAAARIFLNHPRVSLTKIVIGSDHRDRYEALLPELAPASTLTPPAIGGATRQASVLAGLDALEPLAPDIVLVHDAARPFATAALIDRAIDAVAAHGGATPGIAVSDTICVEHADGARGETIDRSHLRALQTPQAFRFADLLAAHRRAADAGRHDFTDDGALFAWAGGRVAMFEGEARNVKLTTAEQFEDEALRRAGAAFLARGDVRVGSGFDVHAFGPGDHVALGGVRIPHEFGLAGHSDADVALHALTDAILGALADGDIGSHFPPSDMRWKGADSAQFLVHACDRVRAAGGAIAHLDLTIIGERPKIGPHRDAIRTRVAEIAALPLSRVAVKATTTERLGFTGRSEGLAAMASATIRLPFRDDWA